MPKFNSIFFILIISFLLSDVNAGDRLKNTGAAPDNKTNVTTAGQQYKLFDLLYDQTSGSNNNGILSQDFEPVMDYLDCQAADDFNADNWKINQVILTGYRNGADSAEGFNIYFYSDSGGVPGMLVYSALSQPFYTNGLNLYIITLDSAAELSSGIYWISVQCRLDQVSGNRWKWAQVNDSYGNTARWRNPGGGFVLECMNWGNITDCLNASHTDMNFALYGMRNCNVETALNPMPADDTSHVPVNLSELSWTNGSGAVTNEIYFGTDFDSLQLVQSGSLATTWTISPSPLQCNTTYYWKVIEIGDTCSSSVIWSFKTEQFPNMITTDFYPNDDTYWTGYCDGYTKTDCMINTVYPNVGWGIFDVSLIPSGAVIREVNFYGFVNTGFQPYWSATPMGSVNPIEDDASVIKEKILSGSLQDSAYIFAEETTAFTTGWLNYPMLNSAVQDLQMSVNSGRGWFAVGFVDRDFSTYYYLNFDGWCEDNPPYLEISYTTSTSVRDVKAGVPENYFLTQNYPNPFNPSTKIQYAIPERQFVTLKVYDILGRQVASLENQERDAGNYAVDFTGRNLSSGIYIYKIRAGSFTETKKMMLLK